MRFEIRLVTAFVLLGLVAAFVGQSFADDQVEIAKAKAKAIFALKATPAPSTSTDLQPIRDLTKAMAEAKATAKPLYLWVAKFRREIAEKMPPGVHAITPEYHGLTEPHLVIKIHDGDYQLEQSKLDPEHLDVIRRVVAPMGGSVSRAPIIETSRKWVPPIRDAEAHLMDFEKATPAPQLSGNSGQLKKACLCSPLCVCGCNEGSPCQCQTIQGAAAAPTHLGAIPSPSAPPSFAGPVGFGERVLSAPAMVQQSFE